MSLISTSSDSSLQAKMDGSLGEKEAVPLATDSYPQARAPEVFSAARGEMLPPEVLDALMDKVRNEGLELVGENSLLAQLTKIILERALEEERSEHLGYERGDPAGRNSGNSRNGTSAKRVFTQAGPVDLNIPRDRNGSFEPVIVAKHETRLGRLNDTIIAWYSRGFSTRDIARELRRAYGVDVSAELVSRVTDGVVEELREWQNRPLDACYPILYIDALVVKVRTQGTVVNRPAYLAIGVDAGGRKHILGVWLGDGGEGSKFWMAVLTEIRNRGLADVIFCCCDGLKGLPEAIEAVWPQAIVQTCVIHLIRASVRYASWKDRKRITTALRPIYTAATPTAAEDAMDTFELEHGERYPGIVALWRSCWERFSPFLAYPAIIRKIIYTTNMIESVNYQMRKASKTRGHFPDDESALKLLRLIARDISTTRGGEAGTGTQGWNDALNSFQIHFPGRLAIS
jgi:putative transposase